MHGLLIGITEVLKITGARKRALAEAQKSLKVAKALNDGGREAASLNCIGTVLYNIGEFEESRHHIERALRLREKYGDKYGQATCLNNLGVILKDRGMLEDAMRSLQCSKDLFESLGDERNVAMALHNIGMIHYCRKEYRLSNECDEESLSIRRRLNDRLGEASTLYNMGASQYDLGNSKRAQELFERSLYWHQQIGNIGGQARCLYYLGIILQDQERLTEALSLFEQALGFQRHIGDIHGQAFSLNGIGNILTCLGRVDEAMSSYELSQGLFRQMGFRKEEAENMAARGRLFSMKGDGDAAVEALEGVAKVLEAEGDDERRAACFLMIGEAQVCGGDLAAAKGSFERALQLVGINNPSPTGDEARRFLAIARTLLGEQAPVCEEIWKGVEKAVSSGSPYDQARWFEARGISLERNGEAAEAGECYRKSASLYGSCQRPYLAAHVLLRWGSTLARAGDKEEANKQLNRSAEEFRAMGLEYWERMALSAMVSIPKKQR